MLPVNDLKRHNGSCATEIAAAIDCVLDSGWYVLGQQLEAFQEEFADHCGLSHCVGVASGSDALELALRSVGVQPGGEVITVANAGMYSACAILNIGATPIYADVLPGFLTMDVSSAKAVFSERTQAIIVTHLYGRLADTLAITEIANAFRVPVVEDCAQAHGAMFQGRRAGAFGAVGCFSFYPTKNLGALGDAGAVVTNNEVIAEQLARLRQYGWGSKYVATLRGGRNSRLDEMQAAILRAKLRHLDRWNERRRSIAHEYLTGIVNPAIELPPPTDTSVVHLFVIRTPRRDSLREHLAARGVGTDVHYPVPDHKQPAYKDCLNDVRLPITEEAADQVLTLPCFPEMTEAETKVVIDACNEWSG